MDLNQVAKLVVEHATGEVPVLLTEDGKNAAAVALGRRGGLKGGKARAKKLSKQRRIEIAANAARKRWSKDRG